MSEIQNLTEGSQILYVLHERDGHPAGDIRPGIVVRVWRMSDGSVPENGCCNVQVFTDSDGRHNDALPPIMWATSVLYDEKKSPGTWHFAS